MTAPLTAENDRSAEIRSLHKAIEYPTHCDACSERFPCTQIEIADELDRLTADLAHARERIAEVEAERDRMQTALATIHVLADSARFSSSHRRNSDSLTGDVLDVAGLALGIKAAALAARVPAEGEGT